jgi:hypothetical protein
MKWIGKWRFSDVWLLLRLLRSQLPILHIFATIRNHQPKGLCQGLKAPLMMPKCSRLPLDAGGSSSGMDEIFL